MTGTQIFLLMAMPGLLMLARVLMPGGRPRPASRGRAAGGGDGR